MSCTTAMTVFPRADADWVAPHNLSSLSQQFQYFINIITARPTARFTASMGQVYTKMFIVYRLLRNQLSTLSHIPEVLAN